MDFFFYHHLSGGNQMNLIQNKLRILSGQCENQSCTNDDRVWKLPEIFSIKLEWNSVTKIGNNDEDDNKTIP